MKRDQKATGLASSMPGGLAYGALVSLTLTFLASAILAKLLDSQRMDWEKIGYGIALMLPVASFSGAMMAYRKIKRQRMAVCMSAGAIYLGILFGMTALFFGGQYEAVGTTIALVLGGSLAAGMLGLRDSTGKGRGKLRVRAR